MSFQRGYGDTTYDPEPRPRPDWVLDAPEVLTRDEADAKALRAFWRGTFVGAVAIAASFAAGAAWSQEVVTIGDAEINGQRVEATTVSIAPSDKPGQLAVVTFENRYMNDGLDTGEYWISLPELAVGVSFTWDAGPAPGADRIELIVPEGITCIPAACRISIMEGFTGSVILLDWMGA
jgi:hypothetical protein